ncbi:LLM class F420-dependent oxidoreductase [Candidatus Chloroploca sp. M-50]|uniref:LLM class F420-dependent oxidoreductase n=1 Tax=Candidatus Chloroploca mongolica TaxID=2528176 RepID=A0ABS4D8D3_9CHLR|nr:LLM class F420-dependent oxidoreductase [Candidatus Chloroploca mongolica]
MKRIKVGVQLHPQHTTWASFADAVRHAEALGCDTIWNWDHFFPLYGDPQGPHFEGWTVLTAMATLTTRAEIGCLVSCNSYRNPALLANMAKTIDHISGGRLIFGIGAGWFERDYEEYGYPFGTAPDRLRALKEALPIIKQRWEVEIPPPVRPIPILIGGGGEKVTLKLTAQHAQIWHGFGTPDVIRHKHAVLDAWCAELGRDPAEIERSISPSKGESLEAYLEAGVTHFIYGMGEPWDFGPVEEALRWRDAQ